ncbi:MAG: SAM-dependent methyltransferase [Saprospirales bacterium]|nr:SAM-dependent methyltransferase [Saprospirales bacterium]
MEKQKIEPRGTLYLLPTPLGENPFQPMPEHTAAVARGLKYFVAERAKTARQALKDMGYPDIREAEMIELNERTEEQELEEFLAILMQGHSVGVMSEAGCPGVADPGARAVAWAHRHGVKVVPLIGPSSILLALMASGMNGQSFCFHGYLPQQKGELAQRLRKLEQQALTQRQTQLFIETPYRNDALLEVAFQTLGPSTRFCIAADLSLETEFIAAKTIKEWNAGVLPNLNKRPAIFLIGS